MPESDTITVVVTITRKDYAAAVRGIMKPWTARLLNALFVVSLAALAYFTYEAAGAGAINDFSGLLCAVGIALGAGYFRFGMPVVAARDFVSKNPDLLSPTTQTIGPSGVFTENARGQAALGWNAFQRVRETRDLFLLYPQSNYATIVPKRCFNSPDDVWKYREIIRRYCLGTLELKK